MRRVLLYTCDFIQQDNGHTLPRSQFVRRAPRTRLQLDGASVRPRPPPFFCVMETLPEPVGLGLVQQPSPVNVANDIPTNLTPAQPFSIRALLASEPYDPCVLLEGEHYWRDRFLWLKEHGYTLRPRYSPDWKPSWVGTNKNRMDCEDNCLAPGVRFFTLHMHIMRATNYEATARSCFGRNPHLRWIRRCSEEDIAKSAPLRGRNRPILVVRASCI